MTIWKFYEYGSDVSVSIKLQEIYWQVLLFLFYLKGNRQTKLIMTIISI